VKNSKESTILNYTAGKLLMPLNCLKLSLQVILNEVKKLEIYEKENCIKFVPEDF